MGGLVNVAVKYFQLNFTQIFPAVRQRTGLVLKVNSKFKVTEDISETYTFKFTFIDNNL